jgi:peptidoglycan/LPS O-acetylase OafA/YrhL
LELPFKHIKQFDAIRALAVMMVIVSHWIPKLKILPWGEIGVDIFFVLSGFLISKILYDSKELITLGTVSKGTAIKNFIARRTLRIFPVYYLVVAIHFIVAPLAKTQVRENIEYYLLYASNILFFTTEKLDGIASHFWSLAVEEQFYLVWPWIVLFISFRHFPLIIFTLITVGSLVPLLFPFPHIEKITVSCMNSFAIGALVAYVYHHQIPVSEKLKLLFRGICLFLLGTIAAHAVWQFSFFPMRLVVSIITAWFIFYIIYERNIRSLNFVLENGLMIFIGRISYGIYLYHTLIPWLWGRIYDFNVNNGFDFHSLYVGIPAAFHNDVDVVFKFLLLVLVAWVSWVVVESPINRLKKYFENRSVPSQSSSQ